MNFFVPALFLFLASAPARAGGPLYADDSASAEARVEDLLQRMSLDEKVALLSGVDSMDLPANERLGIPRLRMTDGPLGVRLNGGDKATAFPAGIMMAAAFDPELVSRTAAAMGEETLAAGRDMLLGPCVNIARVPQGGRNFESYGEDPFLASRMAEAFIKGLQSRKVLATVKHFALNNQETERNNINVRVSERAMHEIYLPAFEAAVRAGAWSVMASYNKVNGEYAAENADLLTKLLKERWSFKGFVVSDWGATHSTEGSANAGLDVEMPSGRYFGEGLLQRAVKSGAVTRDAIEDKARRVLRAMIGGGVFGRKGTDRPSRSVIGGDEHRALALEAAQKGIVLLRNDGILPLKGNVKHIAVTGPLALFHCAGGGSSQVQAAAPVSGLEGLKARVSGANLTFAPGVALPTEMRPLESAALIPASGRSGGRANGLYAEYFNNMELGGLPALTRVDPSVDFLWGKGSPAGEINADEFSARWTGSLRVPADGKYTLAVRADDGVRLWLDGRLAIDDWSDHVAVLRTKRLPLKAGMHSIRLEYYEHSGGAQVQLGFIAPVGAGIPQAVAAAKGADAVVVFAGYADQLEGEGMDRGSLELPEGQEELIEALARVNKNVIVVLQAGSPVLMEHWLGKVRAVVQAWYPGQEGGLAIADVLLGRVNPSGRLPLTWPARERDTPSYGNFPGKNGNVDYAEGIYCGYRYFDKKGVTPLYPFGFGLSYTKFEYSDLRVKVRNSSAAEPDAEVSLAVKNTGSRAGIETVQLYVHESAPVIERPEAELKGFARVELAPGETKRVSFRLGRASFAFYDEKLHDWSVSPGLFELRLGASSRDTRLRRKIELRRAARTDL